MDTATSKLLKEEGRMTSLVRRAIALASPFGINAAWIVRSLQGIPKFLNDVSQYRKQDVPPSFRLAMKDLTPMLRDHRGDAGVATGQYFHQDLWAARKIFARRPQLHIDIGSRIDGFVAHLLVFMDVDVIDVLALDSKVRGLSFHQRDATYLEDIPPNSVDSLSSLHAAEHFGLGRYSDPIDAWAHTKFMSALARVLAPGGFLYFSVPIGLERLYFNAHRIFAIGTILAQLKTLRLVTFSYVNEMGDLCENVMPEDVPTNMSGCGLFEFTKD
jgi:SAM-dependent methyltransferase